MVEASRQMTVSAIALRRYQIKYNHYPTSLAALVPEFLSAIPLDPVNGGPLHYHVNTDGTFLLYSVGENGQDDGGNPHLKKDPKSPSLSWLNRDALDWVWPQPATAAEIQKYYDDLATQSK